MQYSSRYLEALVEEFAKLPGIGRKTAQRLAFHVLRRPEEDVLPLAQAVRDVKEKVTECVECGNIAEDERCLLCADPKRTVEAICVVENPVDVVAVERSGGFRGRYHVLGGALSPLDGVGPDELRVKELLARVEAGGVHEVILATSASSQGEATAHYLGTLLARHGVRVTRIARGIPMGSDLEFADQVTILRAFEGRKRLD
jgi:recombination protein RecR